MVISAQIALCSLAPSPLAKNRPSRLKETLHFVEELTRCVALSTRLFKEVIEVWDGPMSRSDDVRSKDGVARVARGGETMPVLSRNRCVVDIALEVLRCTFVFQTRRATLISVW